MVIISGTIELTLDIQTVKPKMEKNLNFYPSLIYLYMNVHTSKSMVDIGEFFWFESKVSLCQVVVYLQLRFVNSGREATKVGRHRQLARGCNRSQTWRAVA